MRLYDTRAKAVVPIKPGLPGRLSVYACGPTVYREAHLGNMRAFLLADLITRVARNQGLEVVLVQNITDVGHLNEDVAPVDDITPAVFDTAALGETDKILAQAELEQRSPLEIARHYEELFHRDRRDMNISDADFYPRASDYVEQMVAFIETLIEKGHAYVGEDDCVYFDARSFKTYGAISGNRLADLKPGHRIGANDVEESSKRFHADWALWKSAQDRTQLVWSTPWGSGFPGWHTECSVMSLDLLGDDIDIHTGGIDLRFPHHEDERAQSNCATEKEVVRHWVHAEHLLFEGRKMSKSTGNIVLVEDVVKRGFDPLAVRLAFLEHKYRQQMDLTWQVIQAANETISRWRALVAQASETGALESAQPDTNAVIEINDQLADDLDTQSAIVLLRKLEKNTRDCPEVFAATLLKFESVFALDLARDIGKTTSISPQVEKLLADRAAARSIKDWAASDVARDSLLALGYEVTDTPDGQKLKRR
jgi:cysteinyl-tRNA synthetase